MEKRVRALGAASRAGSEIQGLSCSRVELLVAKQCVQGGEVVDEARAASQALRRA